MVSDADQPRCVTVISGPGGTYSYPEPLQERPDKGTEYFFPDLKSNYPVDSFIWEGDELDRNLLRRGQCHLDADSARQHAEAEIRAAGLEI